MSKKKMVIAVDFNDPEKCNRPFVDWDGVEQLLEMMNVLPATPRTHFTVKQPPFIWL